MFRQEEDVGGLLKETGQCVEGEWIQRRGRGRGRGWGGGGGLLFSVCPG